MAGTRVKAYSLCSAMLMASAAQAQGVPEVIRTRVNELVAACASAGGSLGDMTGQGRFVIPADLTGDGRTDFLVSEGNFPCTGRPGLFRNGGEARVQIFEGTGPGSARLVFDDRLLAYRLLTGSPVRVQIARRAPACDGRPRCGDELRWSAATRSFDQFATDGRPPASRPIAAPESTAAPSAMAQAPSGQAVAAGPLPTVPAVLAGADARFKAQCQKRYLANKPQQTDWISGTCADEWKQVVASQPVAEALLRAVPAKAGERQTLDRLRQAMAGVRWAPRADRGDIATGRLGAFTINIAGHATPESAAVNWNAVGEPSAPLDIASAFEARGARLVLTHCEKLGVGEGTRSWTVTLPGRSPFALTIEQRSAPTAAATSYYGARVRVDGAAAPRGDTNCEPF